jgi:hypothetical protein
LFGDPAPAAKDAAAPASKEGTAPDAAPAKPEDAPQPKPAANDDPFGAVRPIGQPQRLWTDNTGKFRVEAKLVEIAPTHVRLLKDNGRHATVPMNRLSGVDRQFVERLAAQMKSDTNEKLAGR